MSMPDDKHRRSPADRFRNIIAADQAKEEPMVGRRYPKNTSSPNINLPAPRRPDENPSRPSGIVTVAPSPTSERPTSNRFLPAFWTIASIISLIFNAIMLILIVVLMRTVGSLDASSIGTGVLGGLYTNFERLDAAHIKTTIPLQTEIPLALSVPVQTTTAISLARDVSIPGAHVRINTAQFNIDAPANVTLPAGTTLDAFHMLWEAKRHGARVALYGRKINSAEHQLTFVKHLRLVADDQVAPDEAVRAYHADLARLGIRPHRPLEDDLRKTDTASAYSGSGSPTAKRSLPGGVAPVSSAAASPDEPDFSKMTPAEKARWNLERWKRIVG